MGVVWASICGMVPGLTLARVGAALAGVDHRSSATGRSSPRNVPSRQAMNSATATTATMIVEMALIWGVTPNLIEL